MSKFRSLILIIGLLLIAVAAALLTVLVLYATGTIKTDPIELVFSVEDVEKEYDGTPLTLTDEDYELVSGKILEGHTAQVKLIGSQTNAGEGEGTIEVKVFDKRGFDVTDEYAVKANAATLTVTKRAISVSIRNPEVVYNGKTVIFDEYDTDWDLPVGHKIGGALGKLLNVGDTLPADCTPVVYDAFDNDVTDNYDFKDFNIGEVSIVARPLTIKPKDVSKVYDGTKLTATEYEIISGSLAPGQTVLCTIVSSSDVHGSEADCKEVETEFDSFQILDENGDDVDLNNYELYKEKGSLKIEQRPITIATATTTFIYNGEAQHDDTFTILSGSLAPNQTIWLSGKEVTLVTDEAVENVAGYAITLNGAPVDERNYNITWIYGTLTVKPFDITVFTKSYTKEYDGSKLEGIMTAPYFELSTNLWDKFTVTADCDAAVKNQVDAIAETSYAVKNVAIKLNGGDNTDYKTNFNINIREGKYSITPKHEDISLNKDLTKEYTGNTIQITKNEAFGDLPDGLTADDFEISYLSEIKNAGTHYFTATYKGTSGNYDISVDNGTVEVEKMAVTLTYDGTPVSMTYNGKQNYYPDDSTLIKTLSVGIGEVKSATFTKELESVAVDSVIVYGDDGEDITSNLVITYGAEIPVTLTARALTITLNTYTNYYVNEEDLSDCISLTGIADGDTFTVKTFGTDGYSSYWIEDYEIVDSEGNDVKDLYDYTLPTGTFIPIIYS